MYQRLLAREGHRQSSAPLRSQTANQDSASIAFTQRYSAQSKHTSIVEMLQHKACSIGVILKLKHQHLPHSLRGTEARPPVLHRGTHNKFRTVMQAEEQSWSACHIRPCRGYTLALSKRIFCRPARGPRILGRYSERVKSILESLSAIAHNSLLC